MEHSLKPIITKDYKERFRRIQLFEPLEELARKSRTDGNGKVIDIKSLGLFTLLFFFEMKLMRERKTGIKELAQFLQHVTESVYKLDEKQWEDMARLILTTFRPGTGKKRIVTFYNWETGHEDEIIFSYIKATDFDAKTNRQFYALDDDGLELVFATKEYFQEFQLSIHQLMLRKLLEKGEFSGALRQINEMRMDVETISDRMLQLEHEIKRNIISLETQNRFLQVIEDRNYRLQLENEEFQELQQFVKETKQMLYYQTERQEKDAYDLLLQIEKELSLVHSQHRDLFNQGLLLKKHALEAAEEALYYVGVDQFNFDQDITSTIISTPLPLESMKGIVAPFLTLEKKQTWSLLSIFAPQSWSEEEQSGTSTRFAEILDEEAQEQYAKQIRALYGEMMVRMLTDFEGEKEWTLQTWINQLNAEHHPWLEKRQFYDFILLCHQRSPLSAGHHVEEEGSQHLLDKVLEQLKGKTLDVQELPELIKVNDRFEIQNMLFIYK
ncbi:replicative DNA helicase [Calidifontibacillus erzurumensis]|uniref:Replicative DNA helicase n=1 Tax=Calidifontibacillus erzurumensis TaxID=2741433 RepID=A0A8J8GI32_9BACI|nr:replicative DNA helicase [Calidifontibacillus erzurumensis]NSL52788.1 replicative DNA helicase [Calidifontibacillus erzurumensis]